MLAQIRSGSRFGAQTHRTLPPCGDWLAPRPSGEGSGTGLGGSISTPLPTRLGPAGSYRQARFNPTLRARCGNPLAIITARVRLLPSVKQDLLRRVIRSLDPLELGSRQFIRKLDHVMPEALASDVSTKYRCHRLCHLQMSLSSGSGGGWTVKSRRKIDLRKIVATC
jgi:hypothetical protein